MEYSIIEYNIFFNFNILWYIDIPRDIDSPEIALSFWHFNNDLYYTSKFYELLKHTGF